VHVAAGQRPDLVFLIGDLVLDCVGQLRIGVVVGNQRADIGVALSSSTDARCELLASSAE